MGLQITNFRRDWTIVKFTLPFARKTGLEKLRKATGGDADVAAAKAITQRMSACVRSGNRELRPQCPLLVEAV